MTEPKQTLEAKFPETLPIFPLHGVLLLPRCTLPLNVFESRYLSMMRDAMDGDRMIGIIQPREEGGEEAGPQVYDVGCAGCITELRETDSGRYLITLTGVARFRVEQELCTTTAYRRIVPAWDAFGRDLRSDEALEIERQRLLDLVREYFKLREIEANWEVIERANDEQLVNSLAMICPFEPSEKQALLEARSIIERSAAMMVLMEMIVLYRGESASLLH